VSIDVPIAKKANSEYTAMSAIERAVSAKLSNADLNKDGKLDHGELVSLVKDLVYENRTNRRLIVTAVFAFLLLFLSLGANFGLLIWAQELSKEAHVLPTLDMATHTDALPSSGRMLQRDQTMKRMRADREERAEQFQARMKEIRGRASAMTSTDGKSIVATQEATEKLPLFVCPSLDEDKLQTGPRSISFDVFDYEQKANVAGGQTSPYLKTRTMDIEEIERFSRTHVKFKGKDGEEVEVKDGIAYATNPDTALSTLFGSRALAGTALEPHEMRHAMASVGSTRPQVNSSGSGSAASPRHYATADLLLPLRPQRHLVRRHPLRLPHQDSHLRYQMPKLSRWR
jgi:hypothetical protein